MIVSELFEDIFVRDRMRAFTAIKQHPRAFTHFSSGIRSSEKQRSPSGPKLGVNPRAGHHDTPGIYFYYNSWLLTSDDMSDNQYATSHEHYWICDIKKTKNCVDFGNFDTAKAAGIARRNGWYEEMEKTVASPAFAEWITDRYSKTHLKNVQKNPGRKFWTVMDYIANETKTFSWLQMLKGVDAIFDPGKGIINEGEPAQVVVLNKSLIKVITFGENRNDEDKNIFTVIKKVAEEVGGKFSFENKSAVIRVERNGIPISLRYYQGNIYIGKFENGVWVEQCEKRSYSTEDLDWFAKGLKQQIDGVYLYKKPEATGRVSSWTENKINAISKLITRNPMRIRGSHARPGGILYFTTGRNGWGAIHFNAQYSAQPNDTLDAEIEFYTRDGIDIKAVGSYPSNQSQQAIAQDLLQQLRDQAEKQVQLGKITNIESLKKVTGLNI